MSARGDEAAYPASTTTLAVPGHEHTETAPGFTKREVEMIEYRKAALTGVYAANSESISKAWNALRPSEQKEIGTATDLTAQTCENIARAMYAAAHPEDQDDE